MAPAPVPERERRIRERITTVEQNIVTVRVQIYEQYPARGVEAPLHARNLIPGHLDDDHVGEYRDGRCHTNRSIEGAVIDASLGIRR